MSITSVRANAQQTGLCSLIIGESFGSIVQSIANALLSGGRANVPRLIQVTHQSPRTVKESLFILIQHGLVTFAETSEGGRRGIAYYEILPLRVLLRNQFPFYASAAKSLYGEEGAWIVHEILSNGRLSFPDLLARKPSSESSLRQLFIQLYQSQLIVKCSPVESITLLDRIMGEEDAAIEKKGSLLTPTEITKLKKELASKRTLEASSAASASSAKRKRVLDFEELQEQAQDKNEEESIILSKEDYYRVNDERFRVYYRNKEITELAEKRINVTAGTIMGAILQEMAETAYPDGITLTKISTLIDSATSLPVDGSTGNRLHDYLETLSQDESHFLVKKDEKGGGQYKVDIDALSASVQQRHLESIIQEKWGLVGCRIWRLLSEKGKLDEKQVSKLALISPKAGRELLYRMLNAGFVFLQDVPKTADHSASRTFFLWYVSLERSMALLLGQSYKVLENLKIRAGTEEAARSLLLEKTKRLDVVSGQAKLSELDQRGLAQLNKTLTKLKLAELHIEKMLMLIRDMRE